MVVDIDERKISRKRLIKVRSFPGATCFDMYHYLVPILEKNSDNMMLHETLMLPIMKEWIVDKLLKLKSSIVEQLPTTHVVISHPIMRTDSKRLAMKITDIQSHLCKLQIYMIENGNINSNYLISRGLHLNSKGMLQFAKKLIKGIRKL